VPTTRVPATPQTVVKGKEETGAPFVLEILTWKDHDAPDHAPAEVKALWAKLEDLCEKRDGHRGIGIRRDGDPSVQEN
jgi:hypothetical protein